MIQPAREDLPGGGCQAIVAEFVFGPQRCGEPSTGEAIDATWGTIHPVCDAHTPRWTHCDHSCDPSDETAMTAHAKHYLDCPVWATLGVTHPTPPAAEADTSAGGL